MIKKLWHKELPSISADVLFEIENELSEPTFQGVSLGSTLGDIFTIEFLGGQGSWGLKSRLRQMLSAWYHRYVPRKTTGTKLPDLTGRDLFTWSNDTPRYNELLLPVIEAMGGGQCSVVGRTLNIANKLPTGVDFFTFSEITPVSLGEWRREFQCCYKKLNQKLSNVLKKYSVPQFVLPRLMDALVISSQRVMAWGRFLDATRPRSIVTEYDRNNLNSCLILAAKSRGIPTMTMIHGVINPPYGYTPLLADLAFCWGELQRDQLVAMGVPPDCLVITGCQRMQRSNDVGRGVARAKGKLPCDRPLALLATNPINPEQRHRFVNAFCEALRQNPSYAGAIRLHPSEKVDFYREQIESYPEICFLDNASLTVDESLAAADVIVCHDTGFGFDAVLKGKPVVIFNIFDQPLRSSKELVEKAMCPVVATPDELLKILQKLNTDQNFRKNVLADASEFITHFCAAFGSEAAWNIAHHIEHYSASSHC